MSAITSDWKLSETATSTERSVRSGKSNSRTEDFHSALDSYIAGYWRHLAVIAANSGRGMGDAHFTFFRRLAARLRG